MNGRILTKKNLALFVLIICPFVYFNFINASNEISYNNYQNNLSQYLKQNADLTATNYPNSNITNLTDNDEDSIYGQIESFENNIYVVWQESVAGSFPQHNYDIFFIKSKDNGRTFSKAINLSNSTQFSERPQIAVSQEGIFVVWADTNNNDSKEIIFTKSEDNGSTFSKAIGISNNLKNSFNQEISVFDDNVYVVWQESEKNNIDKNIGGNIILSRSIDSGSTFNSMLLVNSTINSFPKIDSYGNNVYVVWNNENNNNSGVFLVKSSDKGINFDSVVKLNVDDNFGESQISVTRNEILISWGGLLAKQIDNIHYVISKDNGNTFTHSNSISKGIIGFNDASKHTQLDDVVKNPVNIEVASYNNMSFIVWQNSLPKQNEDILLLSLNEGQKNLASLLNLSSNPSVSECPSITISNGNIYVIWEDYIDGNHEILFTKIFV
jgi:hypothetical protein